MDSDALFQIASSVLRPADASAGGDAPFVVIPDGFSVESLEKLRETPQRARGVFKFFEAGSLVEYVQAMRTEGTRVFADPDARSPQLVCIIDGHTPEFPMWGEHRAVLALRQPIAWAAWAKNSGNKLSQEAFATFLEDRVSDIAEPNGADVVEIAQHLNATKSVQFKSALRLSDGQRQFLYEEEVRGTAKNGEFSIPESFVLGLSPFIGSAHYRVTARLRYRIEGGHLVLWYDLHQPDKVIEDAVADIFDVVQRGLPDIPFHLGQPPA